MVTRESSSGYHHTSYQVVYPSPGCVEFTFPTVQKEAGIPTHHGLVFAKERILIDFEEYGISSPITRAGLVGLLQMGALRSPVDLKKILENYKMHKTEKTQARVYLMSLKAQPLQELILKILVMQPQCEIQA